MCSTQLIDGILARAELEGIAHRKPAELTATRFSALVHALDVEPVS